MTEFPRIVDSLPSFATELKGLLENAGRFDLAAQISELRIYERCRCGDDFCATFYTAPKPKGAFGPNHENIALDPEGGVVVLDLVNGQIMCVEVIDNPNVKATLSKIFS